MTACVPETAIPCPAVSAPLMTARFAASIVIFPLSSAFPPAAVAVPFIRTSFPAFTVIAPAAESISPATVTSFAASSFIFPPVFRLPVTAGSTSFPSSSYFAGWVATASRLPSLKAIKSSAISIRASFKAASPPLVPLTPFT